MQLDLVAGRVVEKRLAAGADRGWVRDPQPALPQLVHDLIEVVDEDGEVLPFPPRHLAFDEVHLLVAGVQPRATEIEVGAVTPGGEPEDVRVELDGSGDVVDVD